MNNEIRWQQRFHNFDRAFKQFSQIALADLDKLSDLEKQGYVQRFEYTFELTWKTLKDYLLENGQDLSSPKEIIRQAFQNEIIVEGEVWMEALKKRNLTSHTYDDVVLNKTITFLKDEFYTVLAKLHSRLATEADL